MVKLVSLMLFSLTCFALEGVVMSLESPLFQRPQIDSLIVQRFRKGEIVTLSPIENSLFHQTVDRNGGVAYILKKHIKLITNDDRESEQPIQSFQPDLTDYRIEEPLPEGHPFPQKTGYRGFISFGPILSEDQAYQYSQGPQLILSSSRTQLFMQASKAAFPDERNPRLYYGGFFRLFYGTKEVQFSSGETAYERSILLTLGPILTYDLFRKDQNRFVLSGGMGIDLINTYLVEIGNEHHIFRGMTLGPLFSFQYQLTKILGKIDFVIGPTAHLILFQKLKSDRVQQNNPLWNNQRQFQRDLFIDLALSAGLQYSY